MELTRYKGRGTGGGNQYQISNVSLASISQFAGQSTTRLHVMVGIGMPHHAQHAHTRPPKKQIELTKIMISGIGWICTELKKTGSGEKISGPSG